MLGIGPRDHGAALGLRPALRRAAGEAVPLQASRRRFSTRRRIRLVCAPLDIAIRRRRSGARGVGESPVGAGARAVMNAHFAAAVGDEIFQRAPVTADMILTALEAGKPMHEPLTANI